MMLDALTSLSASRRRRMIISMAVLFLVLGAHTMLETARDALFLAELSSESLAFAYVLVAVLAALLSRLDVERGSTLTWSLAGGAIISAMFFPLTADPSRTTLFALYVWPGVLTTTVLIQFWVRLHRAFDVEQAKRLFALVGAAAMVGALTGLAGAVLVTDHASARWLIPFACGALVLAAALARYITHESEGDAPPSDEPEREALSWGDWAEGYHKRLFAIALSISMAITVGDYLFKVMVADVVAADEIAGYLARFYAVINGVAILVQLVLVPWLLRRRGVHRGLLVLPALLLASALGAAIAGGLVFVLLMRASVGSLQHSLHATSTEILFLPIPAEARKRVKRLVAALGDRGGKAVASGLLLLLAGAPRVLAVVTAVLSACAVALIFGVRRDYIAQFRERLRSRSFDPTATLPALDVTTLENLVAALNSPHDWEVIAALDMLRMYDKVNLVPTLLLQHRSDEVVERAVPAVSEHRREEVAELADALLDREVPAITAAALRVLAEASHAEHAEVFARYHEHEDVLVSITARALSHRDDDDEIRALCEMGASERQALAMMVHLLRGDQAKALARAILEHEDVGTFSLLARSLKRNPKEEAIPELISMLPPMMSRDHVRAALVALGDVALDELERKLGDTSVPFSVRRHIPRTISRFEPRRAAPILSRRLDRERDERIVIKILRGLGRLVDDQPRLSFDKRAVRRARKTQTERATRLRREHELLRAALERLDGDRTGGELLMALLRARIDRYVERILRLSHLLNPHGELWMVHAGCYDPDPQYRAISRELLRYQLPRSLRDDVLALVPDRASAESAPYAAGDEVDAPLKRLRDTLDTNADDASAGELSAAYCAAVDALGDHEEPAIAAIAEQHAAKVRGSGEDPSPRTHSSGTSLERLEERRTWDRLPRLGARLGDLP